MTTLESLYNDEKEILLQLERIRRAIKILEEPNIILDNKFPKNGSWEEKIKFCLSNNKRSPRQVAEILEKYESKYPFKNLVRITSQYLPKMNNIRREKYTNKFLYFI